MAQPALAYGTATITLPYPSGSKGLTRMYEEVGGERRTITGQLRRWVGSYWYGYRLDFEYQDRTVYDAIISLVRTAAAANAFPTFQWTDGPWLSAGTAVQVSVKVGELQPGGPLYGYVNWSLDLIEATPRS